MIKVNKDYIDIYGNTVILDYVTRDYDHGKYYIVAMKEEDKLYILAEFKTLHEAREYMELTLKGNRPY